MANSLLMATILNIETSTAVCSVALAIDGKIVNSEESLIPNAHAEKLAVFIASITKHHDLKTLDAIAIGTGPGSYTGLRIGTSTAKGLCYSLNKPLIAVPTLKAMALSLASIIRRKDIFYCALVDARRLEVYTGIYSCEGNEILPVEAKILNENSFSEILKTTTIAFGGDGMPKLKKLFPLENTNCIWVDEIHASAQNMILLAEESFAKKEFTDVAYYEPFYLKDFVAGKKVM